MLKIRLARGGSKKRPYYYIVVADSHSPRDGKFLERVGTYNPMLPKDGATPRVTLKADRISEWLGKGAQPTWLSLVRHTTQPGLNSAPATHTQPRAASCAQRPW